jgi:hypothetical protein
LCIAGHVNSVPRTFSAGRTTPTTTVAARQLDAQSTRDLRVGVAVDEVTGTRTMRLADARGERRLARSGLVFGEVLFALEF